MSDDGSCSYEMIKASANHCEFVTKYCSGTYINFYDWHYCNFDEKLYFTLPIFLLLIFICFRLLSSTANDYLSSSLTTISEKLGMSQNLAGVTFLALGNGAPDVISSIVASNPAESESINFALGALMGGGIFITTLVFSLVVFYSGRVKVEKHLFIRDVSFYIFAMLLIFLFSINKEITLIESILFLLSYIAYVLMAFIQERALKKRKKNKEEEKSKIDQQNTLLSDREDDKHLISLNEDVYLVVEKIAQKIEHPTENKHGPNLNNLMNPPQETTEVEDNDSEYSRSERSFSNASQASNISAIEEDANNNEAKLSIENDADTEAQREGALNNLNLTDLRLDHFKFETEEERKKTRSEKKASVKGSMADSSASKNRKLKDPNKKRKHVLKKKKTNLILESLYFRIKRHYLNTENYNFKEMNLFYKALFILIDFPFNFLRDITVPPCELKAWNRIFFTFMPITCVTFILLITGNITILADNWFISIGILSALILLCVILNQVTYRNRLPSQIILLCIFSFIMAVFWLWFVANILLDILNTIGDISGLPAPFLGLTLLSWGNSMSDLSLDIALAKSGYGEMGIAGCIGGPLFNLLVGAGISLIRSNTTNGKAVVLDMYKGEGLILLISASMLSLNLIILLVNGFVSKFNFKKSTFFIGIIFYVLFLVAICVLTFGYLI